MLLRLLRHIRHHVVGYIALVFAIGAGGGYAIAASRPATVSACADKGTGILHLHRHGRCKRSQIRVAWNQRGPQGLQGRAGAQGAPAPTAWAEVASTGVVVSFASGKNVTVQRVGLGTYAIQVAPAACPDNNTAPVVTPAGAPIAGALPIASVAGDGRNFTVYTGTVSTAGFTPADEGFNVSVPCD
jgi:hypothetical protein